MRPGSDCETSSLTKRGRHLSSPWETDRRSRRDHIRFNTARIDMSMRLESFRWVRESYGRKLLALPWASNLDDHYFSGLNERGCLVAHLHSHFARRVGCDDGCDALASDRQADLC